MNMDKGFRSGFVSMLGRPNVGKSTFLNRLLGTKVSITTDKPQTTRDRISGILNTDNAQIIFLDTPGIHTPNKALNRYMVSKAVSTLKDADVIMFMVDHRDTRDSVLDITPIFTRVRKPVILVFNKIDLVEPATVDSRLKELGSCYAFSKCHAISSLNGDGIEDLVREIVKLLPGGPVYYPKDFITDMPVRFICKELIRERVFSLTHKEIPYSVAVVIEEFREGDPTYIRATIHVERESQKGIIIGRGGEMLKKIGTLSRIEIEKLLGCKVFLDLFVSVTKNWTKDPVEVKRMGYR